MNKQTNKNIVDNEQTNKQTNKNIVDNEISSNIKVESEIYQLIQKARRQ